MKFVYISACELPAEKAVAKILKEIELWQEHNETPPTPEQTNHLISDYSDNEERTFILRDAVWAKLKKEGKI
ncbi:MAG: hypothetical protein KAS32_10645 [Candidatus Peribacteraceae bacterium]|nr:hypothetical protein [Candidatus Peribacteraceae bacterium]